MITSSSRRRARPLLLPLTALLLLSLLVSLRRHSPLSLDLSSFLPFSSSPSSSSSSSSSSAAAADENESARANVTAAQPPEVLGDGNLDQNEFTQFMRSVRLRGDRLFDKIDLDGDGQVSWREVIRLPQFHRPPPPPPPLANGTRARLMDWNMAFISVDTHTEVPVSVNVGDTAQKQALDTTKDIVEMSLRTASPPSIWRSALPPCPPPHVPPSPPIKRLPICNNECTRYLQHLNMVGVTDYAGTGQCDDGGEGSDWGACSYGTDCDDCGPRPPLAQDADEDAADPSARRADPTHDGLFAQGFHPGINCNPIGFGPDGHPPQMGRYGGGSGAPGSYSYTSTNYGGHMGGGGMPGTYYGSQSYSKGYGGSYGGRGLAGGQGGDPQGSGHEPVTGNDWYDGMVYGGAGAYDAGGRQGVHPDLNQGMATKIVGASASTLSTLSSAFGIKDLITPPPPPPPSALAAFFAAQAAKVDAGLEAHGMGTLFTAPPPPPPDVLHSILFH
mmetsp:Transcript_14015/g.42759  ORF Transcript_14015/g.42759 Transcript_14015/m.42759 type:complete len:501 (-) Transcript_14015:471-1973(-)